MRIGRINLIGVFAASVVMYANGALIYGLLFSDLWMSLNGYTHEGLAPYMWKMSLSPIMPILGALGVAGLMAWRGDISLGGGLTAATFGFIFAFAARLYVFVYGPEETGLIALDAAHLFATYLAAGLVLGIMK